MSAKQQSAPSALTKRGELEDLYRQQRELVEATTVKLAEFRARELQLIAEIRQQDGAEISPNLAPTTTVAPQAQASTSKRAKRVKAQAVPTKRGVGRPREVGHPLIPYIPGGNLTAFATSEGLEWSRVSGWGRADKLGRQIPEYWAKKWQKRFGIPLDAWPKGVRPAR